MAVCLCYIEERRPPSWNTPKMGTQRIGGKRHARMLVSCCVAHVADPVIKA